MVYEQVGHKGGPFAKKNMGYKQVRHTCKGGPFARKPWCTSKWGIRGDPLLINLGVRASMWEIRGDPLLINLGV